MVPHLLHVGFAKAGSTFLQEWFAAHPQIAYAKGGFAGYGDVWDVARQGAEPDPAIRLRVTSAEALTSPMAGAGTQGYRPLAVPDPAAALDVCQSLAGLFPDAYVLLVTRGFRSALLSGYSQHVREAGTLPFSIESLEAGRDHLGDLFDYDALIHAYRDAFGDRLIVLPYELLRDDRDAFLRVLTDTFGISPDDLDIGRVNPSLTPVELIWYPRISRLVLRLPLRGRVRQAVLNRYARLTRENRLAFVVAALQRVMPAEPPPLAVLTNEFLEPCRGRADSLRGEPLFAPYQDDYLLSDAG